MPFFAIGVETHPVWKDEVFQNYPEIRQLRTVQWTQRAIVREAIGKLHTIVSNFDLNILFSLILKTFNILRVVLLSSLLCCSLITNVLQDKKSCLVWPTLVVLLTYYEFCDKNHSKLKWCYRLLWTVRFWSCIFDNNGRHCPILNTYNILCKIYYELKTDGFEKLFINPIFLDWQKWDFYCDTILTDLSSKWLQLQKSDLIEVINFVGVQLKTEKKLTKMSNFSLTEIKSLNIL